MPNTSAPFDLLRLCSGQALVKRSRNSVQVAQYIGVNLTYKLDLANFPGLTFTPNPEGNFARGEQIL
ncbi:MAG: hypothetical protein V7L20_14150 [Nostoc sp.]|uniref:hypothetical protein n=1 Tax=Nostoc sp. TaxID=1180 RepID=UPI002FFBE07A